MATPTTCPKCGAPVAQPAGRFCMACGAALAPADAAGRVRAQPAPPPNQPQTAPVQPAPVSTAARPPAAVPKAAAAPTPSKGGRRFTIVNLRNLFGLFDLLALVVGLGFLAFTLLRTPSTQCQPLDLPASHTVADSRRTQAGTLDGFVVFQSGQTYLIAEGQALTIPEDGTLLIEPGAHLQFGAGSALDVHGRLHACGSSGKPIVLTSDQDDPERKGAGGPQPGDWIGVRFFDESNDDSVLGHVQIRYAGRDNHGAVHLGKASPHLSDLTITDSKWFPLSMAPSAAPVLSGKIEFTNTPARGIEVRGGEIREDVTWENTAVVYIVTGNVRVNQATRMTIKPDVVVKFAPDTGLEVEGTLMASGNGRGAPKVGERGSITFTSLKDDEVAGDTDGRAAVPEAGDWYGILLRGSSSRSILHGALIRYAGKNNRGAVHIENASPEISGNRIGHSAWYAISADAGSGPKITGNVLAEISEGTGLEIRGGALQGRETWRWQATDSDMVRVLTGNLTIGREGILELGPGLIVRFARDTGIYVDGALRIMGEKGKPVTLTSLRDDAADAGGDVDGSAARPVAGDWKGITINRESNDRLTEVHYAVVRYPAIGLQFTDVSPVVEAATISDTTGLGIACEEDAKPTLTGVTYTRTGRGDTNCNR